MELENKVSIITGGSRGIGKAIATLFAKEGSKIVLVSRTMSELKKAKKEIEEVSPTRVEIACSDVSKPEHVEQLVDYVLKEFSTIDILVNCAGTQGPIGLTQDVDTDKWLETFLINLYGTYLCIKAVFPTMIKNKSGKIICLAGGGAVSPRQRFSAYSASKGGVVRLVETLAQEVEEYNICINSISPGAVNTKMLEEVLKAGEAAGEERIKAIKQKENGGTSPDKAAELSLFLASSKSDGLTGRLISAVWDNWRDIPQNLNTIMKTDIYTVRRLIPGDRGHNW